MIVPMKKITLIVQSKDADSTIEQLRSMGVLHVEHQQAPKGQGINNLKDDIALIDTAMGILSKEEFVGRVALQNNNKEPDDWRFTTKHIIDLYKRFNQLEEYSRTLKQRISRWQAWGDFEPDEVRALSKKNVYIRFYQIPLKEINNFPSGVFVKKISILRGVAYCVVISQEKFDIPFKELELPKIGLKKMHGRLSEDNRAMEFIKDEIRKHTCYVDSLLGVKRSLQKELEFNEVLKGMGQDGDIVYLTGYTPFDTTDALMQTAKKQKWGIVVSEPSEEDRVPTLIRNPRLISIIRPIFKIIEVVPGYRELDISLWFLLFFSVFFGMLIGDAGYGSTFFILTFFSQKKWGRKLQDKSIFVLFYILSTCAVLWGVLSGTFFGQEWLSQSVRPLIPGLRNDKYVQAFCFFLGALHLSIAHCWRLIIKLPSLMALADMGWTLILWGAFFLARLLILGDAFPEFGKWLFIGGIGLVVFFTRPSKNILKGIGSGLGNLFLNLVNNFTDIVSYIRLFAVGLATVAVADSFNKMAMSIGYNSIITGLFTSFILLLGHLLNVMLGPMSILVHGVRLNVLEFCNHLDIKWMGFPYRPLQAEKAD